MTFAVGRWRQHAQPIIAAALRDLFAWNPQATRKEAKEVLSGLYPFGQRKYHPYKMWLKECKVQLDAHFRPVSRKAEWPWPKEEGELF